ncbi:putative metalloprotease CJM1_0395 family protein [Amphritea balenae]|uniref:Catalase n=1 Tax=Amphritea balenae TaxID=452629 RepID=A0A3P1SKP8_9GAMM|nr:putative metalloprotease CJM1_0395 family protein [Amphritea balenae]RRC97570.1 hypothetical protein EHS89_17200 [Amphritea balenae]GGK74026.1 hypothetical protein GCM10007941_25100 [Amphritea balenae]
MQLPTAVNSLAVNTNQPLSSTAAPQAAVSGTVASVSSQSQALQSTPSPLTVTPSVAGSGVENASGARQSYGNSVENRSDKESGSGQPEVSRDSKSEQQVSDDEQKLIRELAARDREVRQHELSHAAAGGSHAGAPTFEYQRGPDGRLYAVGGEVSIDTSAVPNDPQATLEKAEIILRAALAVSEPSTQDRAVAVRAAALAADARAELARQEQSSEALNTSRQEADSLRETRRSEALQNNIEDLQSRHEDQADQLQDFNERLQDVNKRLAEINQRLVDAGVLNKFFPEGSILDQLI